MAVLRLLVIALMLTGILGSTGFCADPAAEYREVRAEYDALQKDGKKRMYRHNWEGVIHRFKAIAERNPQAEEAAAALYMAGSAGSGLHRVSGSRDDAVTAVDLFRRMAALYPASNLADDALMLAGGLEEGSLGSPAEAYRLYERLVREHPRGDMVPKARARLSALAAHAPPATPPPVPSAPVAVKSAPPSVPGQGRLTEIRFWSNPGYTRVVLDLDKKVPYTVNLLPGPEGGASSRLYVDLEGASSAATVADVLSVDDGLLRQVRAGAPRPDAVRVVLDLVSSREYKVFPLEDPFRIVIDVSGDRAASVSAATATIEARPRGKEDDISRMIDQVPAERPLKVQVPTNPGGASLRRVVVDAGHGGKDPGAVGKSGLLEKDVTLAMARLLAERLEKEIGCEVILTRDRDIYIPLEERTAIANKVGADLFISIHANASTNSSAHGIETYYLNFSKNEKAMAVAARENGTSLKQVGDLELILLDLMANAKINESSRLAAEVQNALVSDLNRRYGPVKDLGVRQGPFYVLVGATMPSVLVETAFISNAKEEKLLTDKGYQKEVVEAITRGVGNYAKTLRLIAGQ